MIISAKKVTFEWKFRSKIEISWEDFQIATEFILVMDPVSPSKKAQRFLTPKNGATVIEK